MLTEIQPKRPQARYDSQLMRVIVQQGFAHTDLELLDHLDHSNAVSDWPRYAHLADKPRATASSFGPLFTRHKIPCGNYATKKDPSDSDALLALLANQGPDWPSSHLLARARSEYYSGNYSQHNTHSI